MDCGSCGAHLAEGAHGNRRYCSQRCRHREDSRRKADRVRTRRVSTPRELPNIDAADLGWLAGIIDGEGSIALSHGGTRTPHLRVQVTNGSQSILDKIGRTLAAAGITSASFREIRGTTNVSVGTSGALLLHRLLRSHLVRQVDQFDAAVEFMRRRYDEGRLRVYWSAVERAEWERLRQRFHSGAKITEGRV